MKNKFQKFKSINKIKKNLNGLAYCYFLALPFFVNTVLSSIIFTYSAFIANNLFSKNRSLLSEQYVYGVQLSNKELNLCIF